MSGKPSLRRAVEAEMADASRIAGRDVAEDEPAALLLAWVSGGKVNIIYGGNPSAESLEKVSGWLVPAIPATRLREAAASPSSPEKEQESADLLFGQLPKGRA